jgi:hypothetical protein
MGQQGQGKVRAMMLHHQDQLTQAGVIQAAHGLGVLDEHFQLGHVLRASTMQASGEPAQTLTGGDQVEGGAFHAALNVIHLPPVLHADGILV